MPEISPENSVFILICFEGPDLYCRAGGLGVRVAELSEELAAQGFTTHLYFVGDPKLPAEEVKQKGKLYLHRWCQWISSYHPSGVYDGEDRKVWDFERSLPPSLISQVIAPAVKKGKLACILSEDWHTAGATINLSDQLSFQGIRDKCIIFWNANNLYGFEKIDFTRLKVAAISTTVSRYMKFQLWKWGLDALVIPNGIPARMLKEEIPDYLISGLKAIFPSDSLLVKVGRYTPDKGWLEALIALAGLKKKNPKKKFKLLIRGGIEAHRADLLALARKLRLKWAVVKAKKPEVRECLELIAAYRNYDIIELSFFVPEIFLRAALKAALCVLANSAHEPFGLVGLEVMAGGGIPLLGGSGEDYAKAGENALLVEARHPQELVFLVEKLLADQNLREKLKANALKTAEQFTWDKVIKILLEKLELGAMLGNIRI